jgi:hypothetical protein
MATPADMRKLSYTFRDSKGNVTRSTFKIGDATGTAIETDYAALQNHLQAISNATVSQSSLAAPNRTLGTSATYEDVEDKLVLTCTDTQGGIHRFQIPAPKSAEFLADQETVNLAETNMALVVTDIQTFVYGFRTDTAPLTVVGGIRQRRKLHRKTNVFTRSANLDEPGP